MLKKIFLIIALITMSINAKAQNSNNFKVIGYNNNNMVENCVTFLKSNKLISNSEWKFETYDDILDTTLFAIYQDESEFYFLKSCSFAVYLKSGFPVNNFFVRKRIIRAIRKDLNCLLNKVHRKDIINSIKWQLKNGLLASSINI